MGRIRQNTKLDREIREAFANNVRHYREKQGWSQAELAKLAEVTRSAISAIELGRNSATLGHAARLAFHLGTTVAKLVAQPSA